MPLLQFQRVDFGVGGPLLLDHVDLTIEPGERVCIVGRNGAGKSTLMRLMAGVLAGDATMFLIGRLYGPRVRRLKFVRKILTPSRFRMVQGKFARYGNWVLFVARFLPGLRSPIFLTAGMTRRIPFWRFLLLDGLAALISVPVWVYLGYFGAYNRDWLMEMVHRGQHGVFVALGILAVVIAAVWWRRHRRAALPPEA